MAGAMLIRIPTKMELAIQGLLAAVLVLLLVDFFQALDATACSDAKHSQNCYPWGMTEGPLEGGSWGYASKENYLITQAAGIAVLAIAIFAPFLARNRWSGLTALAGVLILGRIGFWLAGELI